ncbi:MAG: divalent cation tolerance protein CutA [Candidatus Eisenbacteria bacterium]|nr:divalent cation tolerance protein CutA [Candidatus Eisenbacteria bacterium]
MATDLIAVYSTLPDRQTARALAERLVAERLVACVNLFAIESVYRWEGQIERADEVALLMKTHRSRYRQLEQALREGHPYDVPAIVAYDIAQALPAYGDWIAACVVRDA